jgi:hypothetical protein
MEMNSELESMAAMFGAVQSFSDRGLIMLLCPELEGKSMQDLSTEEVQILIDRANKSFPMIEIEDED